MILVAEGFRLLVTKEPDDRDAETSAERAALSVAANVNRLVSLAYLFLGKPIECLGALVRAARLALAARDYGQIGAAYAFLGTACGMAGLRRAERNLFRRARKAVAISGAVVPAVWLATSESVFRHYRDGNWEAIDTEAGAAIELAKLHNIVYDRQPLEIVMAMADIERGQVYRAQERLERVAAVSERLGHRQYEVSARGALMLCDLYAGRYSNVIASAGRVWALHLPESLDADLMIVASAIVAAHVGMEEYEKASGALAQATEILDRGIHLGSRPLAIRALFDLVDAAFDLYSHYRRRSGSDTGGLRAVERLGVRLERYARSRPHVRPAAFLVRGRRLEARGRVAAAAVASEKARAEAAQMGAKTLEAIAMAACARLKAEATAEPRAQLELAREALDTLLAVGCHGRAWGMVRLIQNLEDARVRGGT
jgi:hypothetical protein